MTPLRLSVYRLYKSLFQRWARILISQLISRHFTITTKIFVACSLTIFVRIDDARITQFRILYWFFFFFFLIEEKRSAAQSCSQERSLRDMWLSSRSGNVVHQRHGDRAAPRYIFTPCTVLLPCTACWIYFNTCFFCSFSEPGQTADPEPRPHGLRYTY